MCTFFHPQPFPLTPRKALGNEKKSEKYRESVKTEQEEVRNHTTNEQYIIVIEYLASVTSNLYSLYSESSLKCSPLITTIYKNINFFINSQNHVKHMHG